MGDCYRLDRNSPLLDFDGWIFGTMGTHQAFSVLPLLTKLPVKIDCIHVSGQRLFVGAAGGALLVYFMAEKISLIQSKKNLSKSKINQIEALPELGVIFLLAGKDTNEPFLLLISMSFSFIICIPMIIILLLLLFFFIFLSERQDHYHL